MTNRKCNDRYIFDWAKQITPIKMAKADEYYRKNTNVYKKERSVLTRL